jgi:hypothetical protein
MRAVTPEPAHGLGDGHPHAVGRCADLRARLGHRRHRRRGAQRRSTMSRPISARATSSTASWSWCSAASAISGARWSARCRSASPTSSWSPMPAPCSARSLAARLHHPVHPEAPARPVRAQGPGGGSMITALPASRTQTGAPSPTPSSRHRRGDAALLVPLANLLMPAGRPSPFHVSTAHAYHGAAAGANISATRCWRSRSTGLGLLRHPLARPRRLLRARRLCDGHVPDAPDRRARRLRQPDPARLHGVPELGELPWFWYGFDLLVRHADGAAGARPARLRLRLVRLPQPRHRRLSLDHHAGDDLCAAARLLPQRHGLRRQ